MPQYKPAQKGVVLLIVLGTIITIMFLAGAILTVITNHSRLTQHQIDRIKAYYASKAMMNYTMEKLRKGTALGGWDAAAGYTYACHGNCSGLGVPSPDYTITDSDVPFNTLVTIHPKNSAFAGTTTQLDIKTDYTYTP